MKTLKALANFVTGWTVYDPQWLVDLASEQHQDKKWLAEAFSKCTRAKNSGAAYVYFVEHSKPNKADSEWQFDQNISMNHPDQGEIIIDILKGNRVGGIELMKKLL